MFAIGVLAWIAFVLFEWKLATIPIMPRESLTNVDHSGMISYAVNSEAVYRTELPVSLRAVISSWGSFLL
jgi:hypothetical protein